LKTKDFITELSARLGMSNARTADFLQSVVGEMTSQLQQGNSISIQGFGSFEVKKKMERISVNPINKKRMLVPPKLVMVFKPSALLKDKLKGVELS
jgi:DNA-binding protein HU-beta